MTQSPLNKQIEESLEYNLGTDPCMDLPQAAKAIEAIAYGQVVKYITFIRMTIGLSEEDKQVLDKMVDNITREFPELKITAE